MVLGGLVGIVAVIAVTVLAWALADPSCPRCHQRDWSKGVPPWRCRRCGYAHIGAGAAKARLRAVFPSK